MGEMDGQGPWSVVRGPWSVACGLQLLAAGCKVDGETQVGWEKPGISYFGPAAYLGGVVASECLYLWHCIDGP